MARPHFYGYGYDGKVAVKIIGHSAFDQEINTDLLTYAYPSIPKWERIEDLGNGSRSVIYDDTKQQEQSK